jgi:hypothetical protein
VNFLNDVDFSVFPFFLVAWDSLEYRLFVEIGILQGFRGGLLMAPAPFSQSELQKNIKRYISS